MKFVHYCTQNELSADHAPVYPYDVVIRLKYMVSIQLMAVNIIAVNLQVWGLDGTGVLPIQPYCTNHIVRLWCAALLEFMLIFGENCLVRFSSVFFNFFFAKCDLIRLGNTPAKFCKAAPSRCKYMWKLMETRTVKLPKALPNTLWKVMLSFVVATKLFQGGEDPENLKYITLINK